MSKTDLDVIKEEIRKIAEDCYESETEEHYVIIEGKKSAKVKAKPMKVGVRYYSPEGHYEVINSYRDEHGVLVLESKAVKEEI